MEKVDCISPHSNIDEIDIKKFLDSTDDSEEIIIKKKRQTTAIEFEQTQPEALSIFRHFSQS